jgi:cation:H+ antiporter
MGNLIGSNILNILTMLGLTVMIAPARVAPTLLRYDLPVLVVVCVAIAFLVRGGRRLSRTTGALLIGSYAVYAGFAATLAR